jgi:hypothetical protein
MKVDTDRIREFLVDDDDSRWDHLSLLLAMAESVQATAHERGRPINDAEALLGAFTLYLARRRSREDGYQA